jgi:uncharacterized repeat protein (TIGR01451 family)
MRTPSYTWRWILAGAVSLISLAVWPYGQGAAQRFAGLTITPHVIVNEVAWGGTQASTADEWIELLNTSNQAVTVDGWRLVAADGSPDIALSGAIPSYSYYLIERTDDQTVSNIAADLITSFGSGLSNQGEALLLLNEAGVIIDTVNAAGGSWPTDDGGAPHYRAMERTSPIAPDTPDAWGSYSGGLSGALDAGGNPVHGSPAARNNAFTSQWSEMSDLVMRKTGPNLLAPGALATYHLTVTNYGGLTATHIHMVDTLPEGLRFITQTSDLPFTEADDRLSWEIAALPPDIQTAISLTAQVLPSVEPTLTFGNRVTVTTAVSDLCPWNNAATWTTTVQFPDAPPASLLLSGVLYDGYQYNDADEAVEITNIGLAWADLTDWSLCQNEGGQLRCWPLPPVQIPPTGLIWLTKNSVAFTDSFGHAPTAELTGWPRLANTGDTLLLRDGQGHIADAVVYGDGVLAPPDWIGAALQPYTNSGFRGVSGQILSRRLDEVTGLPVPDTNTAADWMQYADIELEGRRVRYPGWDMATLFRPLVVTEPATLTLAVAPDNAYEIIAQTLQRAQTNISIEAYTFRHPALLNILTEKARQGVTVTLLLDGDPVGLGSLTQEWREELAACEAIEEAGGACWFMIHQPADRIFNRYHYLHAKMIIVDHRWLILGSQNLTPTSLPADDKANGTLGSRGAVMVIEAPSVIARAEEIRQIDLDPAHRDILRWNTDYLDRYGRPPEGAQLSPPTDAVSYTVLFPSPKTVTGQMDIELYSAPEAALRRTDALVGLLSRAGSGDAIYIEQQYERLAWGADPMDDQNPRISSYIDAARRGARVRLLLNSRSFVEGYEGPDEQNLATAEYVNTRARVERLDLKASLGDPTGAGIHNKMILIDLADHGKIIHIGSLNGSEAASKINREIIIQVRDDRVYAYYLSVFLSDWYRANPLYLPIVARTYVAPPPPVRHLVITEVCYTCPPAAEWVEIANPGPDMVDLTEHKVGDAETPTSYESMFLFPEGTRLAPGEVLVIAVNAVNVQESHLEFYESDPDTPNLIPYLAWGNPTYPFALRNEGDQVLLLDPTDQIIDAVAWGDSLFPAALPHPGTTTVGASLERFPPFQDTDDCAVDFQERFPPTPGVLSEEKP